ncbi:MAG: ATP-binding protein [Chloroflexota bacterium]|nr:ATP-binding protein [Chloroflexota bacterium]
MDQTTRLRRLREVTERMQRSLDVDVVAGDVVDAACVLTSADASSLVLVDLPRRDMRVRAQRGLSARYASMPAIPMDPVLAEYRGPHLHRVADLREDPRAEPGLVEEGLVKLLTVPLVREELLVGALNIYSRDTGRDFDDVDIELANILAGQAAVAITNAKLYASELRARQLHLAIFDAIGEGVLIGDPGLRLAAMNRAAQQLLGLAADHIGSSLDDIATLLDLRDAETDEVVAPDARPLTRAIRGRSHHGRYAVSVPDRGRLILEALAEPVSDADGRVIAGVLALHDITAEREIARQKDEFISIVSHELKTPLTPLKALAQLLRSRIRRSHEGQTPLDIPSLEQNLRTIERQVDRMNALVSDLLEVSRAGHGRLEATKAPLDLAQLARDVTQRYVEATAEEGRYRFTVDAPPILVVSADAARLEQVLMNLIGNAVKYSPTGGDVRVEVRADDGGALVVVVEDRGIGIPPEEIRSLGHAFVRGGGRAKTFAGVGIGLYLSRLVAEAHGGTIEIESAGNDLGTRVTMRLPG